MINFELDDRDDEYTEIDSLDDIMIVTNIIREGRVGRPSIKEASFVTGVPSTNGDQVQANDPNVEIQALTSLSQPEQHRNIQRLINIYYNTDYYFIVLERYKMLEEDDVDMECDDFTDFFLQMVSALKYIHSKGFAHLDINENNLMVRVETQNERTVVCPIYIDFGSSNPNNYAPKVVRWAERRPYHPPELMEPDAERYGVDLVKYDVWSLGVLVYQMLLGETPFTWVNKDDISYQEFLRRYNENRFLEGYDFYDDRIKQALIVMLNPNPERRPRTEEILRIFGL